jgi:hypothetical protein
MRLIYVVIILSFAYSCDQPKKERIYTPEEQAKIEHIKDSMLNDIKIETVSRAAEYVSSNDPVQVIKAVFFEEEYSSYKSMKVTYRNISGKKISAIKFKWTGENAFGEPADMGSSLDGIGAGFTDDVLGIAKTRTSEWSILSRDGKKVTKAWAYEVVFADGTKWHIQE